LLARLLEVHAIQAFMLLVALIAVPLGRVGLAPNYLARNRHR
jgi:hypothetical protein